MWTIQESTTDARHVAEREKKMATIKEAHRQNREKLTGMRRKENNVIRKIPCYTAAYYPFSAAMRRRAYS